jgi:hypothetical protein
VFSSFRISSFGSLLPLCGVASFLLISPAAAEESWNYGPAYNQSKLTLASGFSREIAGPLLSYEDREGVAEWTLSPLFSYRKDREIERLEYELAYPLLTYDRFGKESRWQFLQLLSWAGGESTEATIKKRFTLFPVYFQQRSTDPSENYTAFLPFYGELHHRLLRDEIHFVMAPLYWQSRKRDVVTDNYLFPFFHRRHGDHLRGWQFWPILGREHKEPTVKTNGFGDHEIVGGHDKRFVIWPIYFRNELGIGTTNPASQKVIIPFYSVQKSPTRDSTTYGFPLGYTKTVDREKDYVEKDAPWPLVVFADGPGKTARRVWPFFSQAKTPILESDFYMWPIYKYNRATSDPLDRERTRILFFLYSDLVERNTQAKTELRRRDFWPLFTARHDQNGNERVQVLAPIEPLMPNNKSIEKTYSPVWSLWRSEKNAKTGARSQSLLWNTWRHESGPERKKTSLLFGLFQYEKGPEGASWRVFYIPFGHRGEAGKIPAVAAGMPP